MKTTVSRKTTGSDSQHSRALPCRRSLTLLSHPYSRYGFSIRSTSYTYSVQRAEATACAAHASLHPEHGVLLRNQRRYCQIPTANKGRQQEIQRKIFLAGPLHGRPGRRLGIQYAGQSFRLSVPANWTWSCRWSREAPRPGFFGVQAGRPCKFGHEIVILELQDETCR